MRVLLAIALVIGLCLPVLLADLQPSAKSVIGSAGSSLVEASVATTPVVSGSTENLGLRAFAMLAGILLLVISAYLAFGRKPRPAPVPVKISNRE